MIKYLRISSYFRQPFLIFDFATAPFWISLYCICTVNVDCVKFEYVVLAKYHHMLIFEFDLLTMQHILDLCKKLL